MLYTFIINCVLVACAIMIHYEALNFLSILIPKLNFKHRLRVLFGLFGAFFAHVLEIWLFAFGYYFKIRSGHFGALKGEFNNSLMDCSYFSFTNYTSLGFGDIHPTGDIRFLAGLEALTGLVLIGWTSSFMFIEMQKLWRDK